VSFTLIIYHEERGRDLLVIVITLKRLEKVTPGNFRMWLNESSRPVLKDRSPLLLLILFVTHVSTLHARLLKLVDVNDKRQCSSILKRVIPWICFERR
jgi:hypothetical protein